VKVWLEWDKPNNTCYTRRRYIFCRHLRRTLVYLISHA